MAEDDRVPSTGGNVPNPAPGPITSASSTSGLKRAAEFLEENCKIQIFKSHYLKYRRYLPLKRNEMFTSLVSLYSNVFRQYYHRFKRGLENFYVPTDVLPGYLIMARVYVSAWFVDLYVSNREAVTKLSSLAFNERYHHEVVHVSHEYDAFMVALNASIRPTHIQGVQEDVLYIPFIRDTPAWNNPNPFNIQNFLPDYHCFHMIIGIMKNEKIWKIQELTTNTLGRPSWLFDWHPFIGEACAPFPAESNYNMDDVTLAYIIGVACTPKIGVRDSDDWQDFPNRILPDNPRATNYIRQTEREFYGSYEVRTIKVDELHRIELTVQPHGPSTAIATMAQVAATKKRKTTGGTATSPTGTQTPRQLQADSTGTSATGGDATLPMDISIESPRFKLIDWTYYARVICNVDDHTRTGAHKSIAFV